MILYLNCYSPSPSFFFFFFFFFSPPSATLVSIALVSNVLSAASAVSLSFFFFFFFSGLATSATSSAGASASSSFCLSFFFNIVNLDSFHVWFLFIILICLPLQCDVGSRLVLEHLALRLVLVELGALLGGGRDLGDLSTFELSDARFHLCAVLDSKVSVSLLSQGVHPASQGGLRGEHSRHFALELRARLSNKLCVVYQAVLGSIVLSLQCLKQSLLSAQNLDCRGGMLGKVH